MTPLLAQLDAASPVAIKDWLIIVGGLMGLVLLAKQLFMRNPPIEAEFVTKAQHEKDMSTFKEDVNSLRQKMTSDSEKIMAKLDEHKTDLMMDGRRRSQALFQHIKDQNTEIFSRLLNNDKKIAALEERTNG